MADAVLKWAWRHGSLCVGHYPTVLDACIEAETESLNGTEALVCIEVVEDAKSVTLGWAEIEEVLCTTEDERLFVPEWSDRRPYGCVTIELPEEGGRAADIATVWSAEEADEVRAFWSRVLGEERVGYRVVVS